MQSARQIQHGGQNCIERQQIVTNEFVNLMYQKRQIRYLDGSKRDFITGMLFRSYSEVDIFELKTISQALHNRLKIPEVDLESILGYFEGHSIFSIFQDEIEVYEHLQKQIEQSDFPIETNSIGEQFENSFLRRLHRVMSLPTKDWKNSERDREKLNKKSRNRLGLCKRFRVWLRLKLGMGDGLKVIGNVGFKPIRQKSMHF